MLTPFQEIVKELEVVDGSDVEHIFIVLIAMAIGLFVGMLVARRLEPSLTRAQALGRAALTSATFPLATYLILVALRLTPYGAATGALPKFAVRVFAALLVVRLIVRVLRRLFPDSSPVRGSINVVSGLIWLTLVLYLAGVLPFIEQELEAIVIPLGKTQVSVLTLLQGLALVAFTVLGALWLSSLLEMRLMATGISMSTRLVLSRFLRASLFVLALLFALAAVGIDLTVLSVFGGALGVGLGLGLQKIASNYVSGFAMLLEGSFRVGDSVKVDNFEGQITTINTRYTVVRALNGRESVVPNEMFIVNRVENLSLQSPNVAFNTKLQIDYASDVELARSLMIEAALAQSRVLKSPAPGALLSDFASDGLELTLGYWIADPENGTGNVRSDINLAIWRAFQTNGIGVPFPQRVIRVVNDSPNAVESLNSAPPEKI
ncbi:MAG: mechanosensitive ion channel domain-containing protein [Casimicrobium sp.]|jgi:small-conductance mechanosensitive channel